MKRIWILTALLLTGCIDETINIETTRNDVLVYADSTAAKQPYNMMHKTFAERLGANVNAHTGRKLTESCNIPGMAYNQYTVVILSIGSNDAIHEIDINEFRGCLKQTLSFDDAKYICVLPNLQNGVSDSAYRDVMLSECVDYVDPYALDVELQPDSLHIARNGHITLYEFLNTYLEVL